MSAPLHVDYQFDCPDGLWAGRLDGSKYGKAQNLLLYFSSLTDGSRYWLSVFWNNGYGPSDDSMSFKDLPPGGTYMLETGHNSKGKPVLLSAKPHVPTREQMSQPSLVPTPRP